MSVTKEIDAWIAEHGSCRDALNVALARLELAQAVLREVEYVPLAGYYPTLWECPWCNALKNTGHSPDCPRQLALTPPASPNP